MIQMFGDTSTVGTVQANSVTYCYSIWKLLHYFQCDASHQCTILLTQIIGLLDGSDAAAHGVNTLKNNDLCNDRPHFIQVFTIMQPHGLLLCFRLLHIFNGLVSTSLVGHVLYSADLMSATCIPYLLLMVHRYIYSRYSSVFLTLYQLYHSLPSSTLISFSSLYLKLQPELLLKVVTFGKASPTHLATGRTAN